MDEDIDDEKDDKRRSRNLSEKKRRDQFNLLVNELSSMVSTNSRKMDKSTVLKSTIAFLKNHNEVAVRSRESEIQENWKPPFLPNEEFTHLILEALDGFMIVFSSSGKINYVSESVTSLLGHLPNELLHSTIYDIVYEEEHQEIYNILLNPPKTVIDPLQNGAISSENQVSFLIHLKRGSIDNPPKVSYEYVQFTGYFRDNSDVENIMPTSRFNCSSGDMAKTLFVGTARIMTPQLIREMSIVDTKSEFTSRHSLEWKFLFLDHRAPPVIGYLPFEVLGTSGYDYYHFDDLDRVTSCHEALFRKGEGTSCFYRFLTKGMQYIWLQTRFFITYHQWNSKPEFVVCTHRVISYSDVMKHMRKNIGPVNDENDLEERKPESSNLMSPRWSSKSSRVKSFSSQASPNLKLKKCQPYRPDSDSTSMSADSPLSHHSMLTHSSVSHRSKSKPNTNQQSQSNAHFSQFNLPQCQGVTQNLPSINQPSSILVGPPQMLPHHHRSQFLDQSQYIATAIPVQPFTTTPDYCILSPTQNQIQDHLQKKHEELQKLIIEQQNELRRVSEQLFMARYGHIAVPVSVPQLVEQSDITENSRCMSTSSHATHASYQEHSQQLENFEVNQNAPFESIQQSDFELIPFQMNHQAQILFSTDKESNISK